MFVNLPKFYGLRRIRPPRQLLASALATTLYLIPRVAQACPGCMNDDARWQRKVPILLGFIGFPFVLFGLAAWFTRRHIPSMSRPSSRSSQE
jgi:hypothetical protein